MASWAKPMSTVRTCVDRCGPTVDPQVCLLALGGQDKTSAYRVIPNLKLLDRNSSLLRNVTKQECRLRVGSVPLVRIRLNDYPSVDSRRMIRLVPFSIIGVDLPSAPHYAMTQDNSPHDPYLLISRNCLTRADGMPYFACNLAKRLYAPQTKARDLIQPHGERRFRPKVSLDVYFERTSSLSNRMTQWILFSSLARSFSEASHSPSMDAKLYLSIDIPIEVY